MWRLNKTNLNSAEEALHKKGWLVITTITIVMLALVGALFIALNIDKSDEKVAAKSAYLLLADYKSNQAVVKDATGKEISKANFPYPSSYLTQHATTPGGAILMSVGQGSANEAFFFANHLQKIEISKEVNQILASSIMQNGKHNIVFINEEVAVATLCPASKTCNLSRVNVKSGKNDIIAETGVKSSSISPVYLLGVSNDKKQVYLRVSGANKFNGETSAVYKFDLVGKKTVMSVKLPFDAGQTVSLSPDEKKIVYKTGGLGNDVEIKLVDIMANKETKIVWPKAEISNIPAAFAWSPDGTKILFLSSSGIIKSTAAADNPQKLAYVDTGTNKITELQTLAKTYLNSIVYYSWLDNNNIIYEQLKTAKENDHSTATREIYHQTLGSRKISPVESTTELIEVLFW